jgi:hypothetical protein
MGSLKNRSFFSGKKRKKNPFLCHFSTVNQEKLFFRMKWRRIPGRSEILQNIFSYLKRKKNFFPFKIVALNGLIGNLLEVFLKTSLTVLGSLLTYTQHGMKKENNFNLD